MRLRNSVRSASGSFTRTHERDGDHEDGCLDDHQCCDVQRKVSTTPSINLCSDEPNRYHSLMDDGALRVPASSRCRLRWWLMELKSCPRSLTSSVSVVASPEKRSRSAFGTA